MCRGHCAPFDAFAEAYFARGSVSVWKACVPDDAIVRTRRGPVMAVDVQIGDDVLGWNGRRTAWGTVEEKRSSGQQPLIRLVTRSAVCRTTADHRVLVYRKFDDPGPGRGEWHGVKWEGVWVRASEVVVGDFLVQPFGEARNVEGVPQEDLAELCGVMIGDGGTTGPKAWISHAADAGYMEHYSRLCEKLFGKGLRYNAGARTSYLYSKAAAEALRGWGVVGTASTKRLPGWLWAASLQDRLAFLRGYLDADGTVRGDGVEWSSCNRMLLEDVRALCLSCGLSAGQVHRRVEAGRQTVMGRTARRRAHYALRCYHFEFGTNDPRYRVVPRRRKRVGRKCNRWRTPPAVAGVRFLRVLKIEFEPEQSTWDFAVSDVQSFTSDTFIVHNSRGYGGKSYMMAALALTEAATLGVQVNVLGGSADQSENVIRYTNEALYRPDFPQGLLRDDGRQAGITKARIRLSNGGGVLALAASSKATRGPHPVRLRIDEADELKLSILDAAMGQPMSRRGIPAHTVLSSTHHYADGTMTEILRRATKNDWAVQEWCYRESIAGGWLSETEVEQRRQDIPAAVWAAEYDLQEPAPQSRAMLPDSVEAAFQAELGEYTGAQGEYIQVEAPIDGARYATGCDWARDRDWTVIVTIRADVQPARVAAFERIGRVPYPVMVARFEHQVRRFRTAPPATHHDATGVGKGVEDMLTVRAVGVDLVGRTRSGILSGYIAAVEAGEIVGPRIEYAYREHKLASIDDVYGAGHLPDSVCAYALAWHGAKRQPWGEAYDV